jgi:hypothetical protein
MAAGKIVEAVRSGRSVRVTAEVDEGAAGTVRYTAEVAIAELKALDTPAKRRNLLVAALKAARDATLEEDALDGQLGQLHGGAVTL